MPPFAAKEAGAAPITATVQKAVAMAAWGRKVFIFVMVESCSESAAGRTSPAMLV
ncbi:hypothetical protein D3C72_2195030 [compost metagenome]